MGKEFLVDTNILIYYLDQSINVDEVNKIEYVLRSKINISIITSIELLSFSKITTEQISLYKNFLSTTTLINISEEIALKAAEIRRDYKLKLPDAVIAATTLIYNFELVTRKDKNFIEIPNLVIHNPFSKI